MKKKLPIILFIFACVIFVSVLIFVSYSILKANKSASNKDYSNTNYSDYANNIVTYEEMFKQEENVYYLYLYEADCLACKNTKNTIFEYIDGYNKTSKYKLYMMDITEYEGKIIPTDEEKENYYTTDLNKFRLETIPVLLLVQYNGSQGKKEITSANIGSKPIIDQLNATKM
jgi:hypothetical protein